MRTLMLLLTVSLPLIAWGEPPRLERVTTKAPFPRGIVHREGMLYILCRGRVRGAGGVSKAVDDQAGTIYRVDPARSEPFADAAGRPLPISDRVRDNGEVFVKPGPPFKLWRRDSSPPEADRMTDRPYCALRYHEASRSFYLCAFSGVDKPRRPGKSSFSKNLTDAVFRYCLRSKRWSAIERHDHEAGGSYPHHDPAHHAPPHGRVNGPDNCLPLGRWLYVVAKDNNRLVRYDLQPVIDDPATDAVPSVRVFGERLMVREAGGSARELRCYGHSALAVRDGWLYVGFRTSSTIVRLRLKDDNTLAAPLVGELVARFDPFDPVKLTSANLTDICFDDDGVLYVVSAIPAKVHRFRPDPMRVYDGRSGRQEPWLDLAARTRNPRMKIENLLAHDGWLYICSGDGYGYQKGALGTVYRARID